MREVFGKAAELSLDGVSALGDLVVKSFAEGLRIKGEKENDGEVEASNHSRRNGPIDPTRSPPCLRRWLRLHSLMLLKLLFGVWESPLICSSIRRSFVFSKGGAFLTVVRHLCGHRLCGVRVGPFGEFLAIKEGPSSGSTSGVRSRSAPDRR